MDEPAKEQDKLSDSEQFNIEVRRDDVQTLDDMSTPDIAAEGEVEKTIPEASEESQEAAADDNERTKEETLSVPEASVAAPAPTAPVASVATDSTTSVAVSLSPSTGGTLVLQWLSYAFWGWFGSSMAILSGITIGYFLNGKASDAIGGTLAYPLAAVIVMLVIALVTDFFYARHEPIVKTGAANVIMLIHAVLYLLVTVGAFITIVFAAISMFLADASTYSDGHNSQKIALLTALVVAVIFGAISFRALFGGKKGGVRKLFWLLMSLLALIAIVGSVAGPAMRLAATKDDRLIEDALPTLARDIDAYVDTNNKLPVSLSDVKPTGYSATSRANVQQLVSRSMVVYKPNTKPAVKDATAPSSVNVLDTKATTSNRGVSVLPTTPTPTQFFYQLCVTYKAEKSSDYYSSYGSDYSNSTVDTSSHPKGEKCYDLTSTGRYSYNY